jgi:hypothetical protein
MYLKNIKFESNINFFDRDFFEVSPVYDII